MKPILFLLLLFLTSCCTKKQVTSHIEAKTTTITERVVDTIVQGDTIYKTIQLNCDSAGRVYVADHSETTGGHTLHKLANNLLKLATIPNPVSVAIRTRDTTIWHHNETKSESVKTTPQLSFWAYLKRIGWHLLYVPGGLVVWEVLRKVIGNR